MKNLLITLLISGLLFMPRMVKAESWSDNFDDGTRDTSLWSTGGTTDTMTSLSESDGALSFNAAGLSSSDQSSKNYNSTWTVDFTQDFQFTAKYNNSSSITGGQYGGVELGLHTLSSDFELWTSAENSWNAGTGTAGKIFDATIAGESLHVQTNRLDSGLIGVRYTAGAADTLAFLGTNTAGETAVIAEYQNFRSKINPEPLHVYLRGWSEGANFSASFDDFQGSVSPEPISAALFLLGGASLVIKHYRKKNTA